MLICILNMYGIYITVTSWSPNLWRISPQVFTQQIEKHFSLVPITTSRNNNNTNYYNFEIQPDNTDKSCVRSWEGIDLEMLGKLTGGNPGAGKTPPPHPPRMYSLAGDSSILQRRALPATNPPHISKFGVGTGNALDPQRHWLC